MKRRCEVCGEQREIVGLMCRFCGKSYDRHSFSDGSIGSVVVWAARRARRFEQRRQRATITPKRRKVRALELLPRAPRVRR